MAALPPIANWIAAFGVLVLSASAARATDLPAYTPVQTEEEAAFITATLGLQDRIAALQQRAKDGVRVEYAKLDLDADGEGEVFIRVVSGADCAEGTCTTMIFNLARSVWVKILETNEAEVTVAKQVHRGYRDILVGSQPWLWTGKAYAPAR